MNTENNFRIFSSQSVPDAEHDPKSELRNATLDQLPTNVTSQSSFVVCQNKQKPKQSNECVLFPHNSTENLAGENLLFDGGGIRESSDLV